jgi:hypothetical protein
MNSNYVAIVAAGGPVLVAVTAGGWAACRECTEDVNAERWDALHARAAEHFIRRQRVPHRFWPKVRAWTARTHQSFRNAHRRGEAN